jgi:hypothetical protein
VLLPSWKVCFKAVVFLNAFHWFYLWM